MLNYFVQQALLTKIMPQILLQKKMSIVYSRAVF